MGPGSVTTVKLVASAAGLASGAAVAGLGTFGASNLVPGDTIQRAVTLSNTGNTNLGNSSIALPGLNSLTSGGSDRLMATLTFPSGAGNSLQSQSSTITFTFTGTQRTGSAQ